MFFVVIVLLGAELASAEFGNAYHGPAPINEVFSYMGRSYLLYSERVSWDEALAICKSNHGTLAVADNSGKAAFLSRSISEAWAPFEDMWIGGQRNLNAWQWVGMDKVLPEVSRREANSTFPFPPWLDGVAPTRHDRDCLAIDRNGHLEPFFVDLECRLPRAFICEESNKTRPEDPTASKVVNIFETEYILYHGRLTWDGAVAFCRQNGYSLASVKNKRIAVKLAVAMLKTRPEFEDAWIGAQLKNGKWSWVADSEEMVASEDYPPWAHPPSKDTNCVLFDRHLLDSPKFISVKCNRVRDFVCMRVLKDEMEDVREPTPTRWHGLNYIVHTRPFTWDEAKSTCEEVDGGRMLELKDMEETMFVVQLMADDKQGMDHVWLGGKLTDDEWQWVHENSTIPDRVAEDGFPPWCETEKIPDMSCLNMDRHSYMTPLLYGLECNTTQRVICVKGAESKGVRVALADKAVYSVSLFSKTKRSVSWKTAQSACTQDVGLLMHDVTSEDLPQIIQNLGEGRFYIGAKLKPDSSVSWIPTITHSPIPFDLRTSMPTYEFGRECLAIATTGEAPGTILSDVLSVPCGEDAEVGYICRESCRRIIGGQDEGEGGEWRCSWAEAAGVDEKTLGKQCYRQCKGREVLRGSNKMVCTRNDWVGAHGSTELPSCLDAASSLSFISEELENSAGAIFIVDNSGRITEEEYRVFKYFVATTVSKFRESMSKNTSIRIIILNVSTESEIVIDDAYRPCEAISKIDLGMRMENKRPTGRRDFRRALISAKSFCEGRNNMSVFFITGGQHQGEPFKETARNLRKRTRAVFAIGIGRYNSHELREMASVSAGSLNMLGFPDCRLFKEAIDGYGADGACGAELQAIRASAAAVTAQGRSVDHEQQRPDRDVEVQPTFTQMSGSEGPQERFIGFGQSKDENHSDQPSWT